MQLYMYASNFYHFEQRKINLYFEKYLLYVGIYTQLHMYASNFYHFEQRSSFGMPIRNIYEIHTYIYEIHMHIYEITYVCGFIILSLCIEELLWDAYIYAILYVCVIYIISLVALWDAARHLYIHVYMCINVYMWVYNLYIHVYISYLLAISFGMPLAIYIYCTKLN